MGCGASSPAPAASSSSPPSGAVASSKKKSPADAVADAITAAPAPAAKTVAPARGAPPPATTNSPNLTKLFAQIDTDNNGLLDQKEIKRALKALKADIDVDDILEALDKNEDGKVSLEEFEKGLPDDAREYIASRLNADGVIPEFRPLVDVAKVFDQFDLDHSGKLSVGELKVALKALGLEDWEAKDVLGSFDGDGDSEISLSEWKENLSKYTLRLMAKKLDDRGLIKGFDAVVAEAGAIEAKLEVDEKLLDRPVSLKLTADAPASAAEGAAPAASAVDADALPECKLRVFHVNDVYILEHLPALKSHVENLGKGAGCKNVLTTLAGDFLGPSLLSSLDHGTGMVDCLNAVPIDAVCFGNHETDVPYESLKKRIGEFKGAWVNSNMPSFKPELPTHHRVDLDGGRSVVLMGFNLHERTLYRDGAFDGAAAEIQPILECAKGATEAAMAAEPTADIAIALTHQDMPDDIELAKQGLFPLILGGHDHSVQSEHVDGKCWVVKSGEDAKTLTVIDLVWPAGAPKGAWPTVEIAEVIPLAPPKAKKGEEPPPFELRFEKDAELVKTVAKWMAPAIELETSTLEKVEYSEGEEVLTSVGVRRGPASMASLIATALRDNCKADAAVINAGGVRGKRDYADGIVTYAHLNAECPFPSSNVVISLDGKTFSDAVAASRATWISSPGEDDADAFHCDYGVNTDAETHAVTHVGGEPLDPEKVYKVVCDAYMVRVNPVLKAYADEHPDHIPPDDAGQPALPILVSYFCDKAWRKLTDADGDGDIAVEEVDKFFDSADVNQDGVLNEEEVVRAMTETLGEFMASRVVARRMLSLADSDQNGTVSREELRTVLIETTKLHS